MKCPNCGAESQGKFCEYCGSEISQEKTTVNVTNNYYDGTTTEKITDDTSIGKCPKCGHNKVSFKRERTTTATQSQSRKKFIGTGRTGRSVRQASYRTIGVCQNCGYTWNPNLGNNGTGSKNKIWLWVLGWIFIFPVPLTILMLRKKDMKPVIKYGIIAVAWILFFIIGFSGNINNDMPIDSSQSETFQANQTTNDSFENKTENKTTEISEKITSTEATTNNLTEPEDETIVENNTTKETTEKAQDFTNKTTNTKNTTTTNKPNSTKNTTTTKTTTKSTTKISTQKHETMVWIPTKGGEKYHSRSDCCNMIDPDYVSLSEAISRGFYDPCGICH